eukprot:m.168721 g.168721  ORF g.168721 m.168721 type:complete len:676 (-) comp17223_c0_seq1:386-2413(-)
MGRADKDLLDAAAENDYSRIIDLCVAKGKQSLRSSIRATLLGKKKAAEAAPKWPVDEDGKLKIVGTQEVKLECRDETGSTPLILAALGGHVEAVECLIVYGANLNAKDSNGNTALHMAAWQERKRSNEVIEILLRNGADTNAVNTKLCTPLHNACQNGQTYIVMLLLDLNADCSMVNEEGDTPLTLAVRFDRREVVALLVSHDAELIKETRAVREAAKSGRKEILQTLLDIGIDCNVPDPTTGDTAIHEACRYFRVDTAELLLSYGADPYVQNAAGETPLSIVTAYQDPKMVAKITQLIEDSKHKEIKVPAVVLNQRRQRRAQEAVHQDESINAYKTGEKSYPPLRMLQPWIEDRAAFCSNSDPENPVTNLLSPDSSKYWLTQIPGRHWVIFDFGNLYTLTSATFTGSETKMMPRDCQLEVGESLNGPWTAVKTFSLVNEAPPQSLDKATGTFTQTAAGFCATSQFWRLMILRNHGATQIMLHKIMFCGVDMLLPRWFSERGATKYFDAFVQAGFNQVKELSFVSKADLERLIDLPGQRKKIEMAIKEVRGEHTQFDRLVFSVPLPKQTRNGSLLPPFEVQANPGVDQEIQLVAKGATFFGTTRKRLVPQGANPSKVVFDDICISPVGKFDVEVFSVSNPDVRAHTVEPIVVDEAFCDMNAFQLLFVDLEPMLAF